MGVELDAERAGGGTYEGVIMTLVIVLRMGVRIFEGAFHGYFPPGFPSDSARACVVERQPRITNLSITRIITLLLTVH